MPQAKQEEEKEKEEEEEEKEEEDFRLPECPLCCEAFDDGEEGVAALGRLPYLLSCGHSFCAACLQRLSEHAHAASAGFIVCPTCNEHTTLRESDAGLRKNFALIDVLPQMKAVVRRQQRRRAAAPVAAAAAAAGTETEESALFGSALPPYNYKEATVVTAEDAAAEKRAAARRAAAAEAKRQDEDPVVCHRHHEEKRLYCRVCAALCCPVCAALGKEHRGHEMVLREQGMAELAKALGEHSAKLQQALPTDRLASVEGSLHALHAARESAKEQIYDAMEAAHAVVDARRDALVRAARTDIDRAREHCQTLAVVAEDQVARGRAALADGSALLARADAVLAAGSTLADADLAAVVAANDLLARLIPPAAMTATTGGVPPAALQAAQTHLLLPGRDALLRHIAQYGRFTTGDEPPPRVVLSDEAAQAAQSRLVPPKPIPVMRLNQEETTPSIRNNPREFFQWLLRQTVLRN